jgi:hypothetical protein
VERNYIWDSNEHFHIIRFYVNGDNIFCQIFFFTGLSIGEHVSGITLAGEADKAIRGPGQEVSVPFYVAPKNQWKPEKLVFKKKEPRPEKTVPKAELKQQATTLIEQLSEEELRTAVDYLTTLQEMQQAGEPQPAIDSETDKSSESKSSGKNPSAQRLIKAMEEPPQLSAEYMDAFLRGIKENQGRTSSPFGEDEEDQ